MGDRIYLYYTHQSTAMKTGCVLYIKALIIPNHLCFVYIAKFRVWSLRGLTPSKSNIVNYIFTSGLQFLESLSQDSGAPSHCASSSTSGISSSM